MSKYLTENALKFLMRCHFVLERFSYGIVISLEYFLKTNRAFVMKCTLAQNENVTSWVAYEIVHCYEHVDIRKYLEIFRTFSSA